MRRAFLNVTRHSLASFFTTDNTKILTTIGYFKLQVLLKSTLQYKKFNFKINKFNDVHINEIATFYKNNLQSNVEDFDFTLKCKLN
jgi:hypothetical protein